MHTNLQWMYLSMMIMMPNFPRNLALYVFDNKNSLSVTDNINVQSELLQKTA